MNYNESIDASVLACLWGGCAPAMTESSLDFILSYYDTTWDMLCDYNEHRKRMAFKAGLLVVSATKNFYFIVIWNIYVDYMYVVVAILLY